MKVYHIQDSFSFLSGVCCLGRKICMVDIVYMHTGWGEEIFHNSILLPISFSSLVPGAGEVHWLVEDRYWSSKYDLMSWFLLLHWFWQRSCPLAQLLEDPQLLSFWLLSASSAEPPGGLKTHHFTERLWALPSGPLEPGRLNFSCTNIQGLLVGKRGRKWMCLSDSLTQTEHTTLPPVCLKWLLFLMIKNTDWIYSNTK